MLPLLVEGDLLLQLLPRAVHARADEAELPPLPPFLPVLPFAAAHDGSENLKTLSGAGREERVDHLLYGLASYGPVAVHAVLHPDASEEKPQVVVDLGDRGDRGARVAARRPLLDRDRGRQTLDLVDVGFLHLPQELARVGG